MDRSTLAHTSSMDIATLPTLRIHRSLYILFLYFGFTLFIGPRKGQELWLLVVI